MKKATNECSICNSKNLRLEENDENIHAPFGSIATIKKKKYICSDCGFSFYPDQYLAEREKALEKSKKDSIPAILNNLKENGYNMSVIERSLDLPARTISRWKSKRDGNAMGLALLRIVNTYPWIIDVAQHKFDSIYSCAMLVQNTAKEMLDFTIKINNNFPVSATSWHSAEVRFAAEVSLSGVENNDTIIANVDGEVAKEAPITENTVEALI